ncbi:MAG: aldehyde dehydrogenase family protein [Deltaproteobacteria bacterium]|nr:aldehyde dehydrogenase family protein [Deltaproteobacteria bacterium]
MTKEFKLLINGKRVRTSSEHMVASPYDGSVVGTAYFADRGLLNEAVEGSLKAFEALKRLPSYRKAELLRKVVEGIEFRREELARLIALEAGKPIKDARVEVHRAATTFRIALEEAKRLGGEVIPLDLAAGSEGRFGIVRRFPIGPVLGITPFNFPLNLVAHKAAPAMACGNPIIIKPAIKTPLTAIALGEIITEAGWPDGGVNVVLCPDEDTGWLFEDERIRKLSFTGSAKVGWMLKGRAGTRRVTLELGGNAGAIVHSDADLDYAAKRCAIGAFSNAGQICVSVQRIYVEKSVYERFKDTFIGICRGLKLGDPMNESTDVGPMIEEGAALRAEEWVKEAVAGGAQALIGGGRRGSLFEPTVLTGAKPSMKVCAEEVFAPIVTLESYDTFEGAVEEVNRGAYGLQAGVFTKDMGRVFYAYERLNVGGVIINDVPTYRVDNMPYGGVKQSGFGREGVRYAIEEMTELKVLAVNV